MEGFCLPHLEHRQKAGRQPSADEGWGLRQPHQHTRQSWAVLNNILWVVHTPVKSTEQKPQFTPPPPCSFVPHELIPV